MRLSPQQRHASETRIRQAMDRLLRGDLPPGGKCDIKTLAREAGIDRTAFYGTRPYTPLREEFENRLHAIRQAGNSPDTRDAQIDRQKDEIKALRERLWSTPGLVETRFSPDALVWVAVVFHGTAAWRNHGLIIFPLLFYRTSVQLRCPAAPPGGGLRPPGPPAGAWASPRRAPAFAPRVPRAGQG